jgi:long-chain fatty acid transport protein
MLDGDWSSDVCSSDLTKDLTLRVGYSHNTNPVSGADVMLNILAPGVVTDHFSAGASYKVTANSGIELAVGYVPKKTVSGTTPICFGGQNVSLSMEQWEASVGYTYKF